MLPTAQHYFLKVKKTLRNDSRKDGIEISDRNMVQKFLFFALAPTKKLCRRHFYAVTAAGAGYFGSVVVNEPPMGVVQRMKMQ